MATALASSRATRWSTFIEAALPDINKDLATDLRYPRIDRFIVVVLWCHFAALTALTVFNWAFDAADRYPSPFSWREVGPIEAGIVIAIGLAAAGIPTLIAGKVPNHYAWRMFVTVCLVTYSYMFVLVSGGAIEMHFHFFMVMALLVVYSDWRLEWIVLVLTALHHTILNYTEAQWVYSYGRNDISVVAHAIPVLATAIFTTILCVNNRRAIADLHYSERELRSKNQQLIDARAQAATDGLTDLQNHRAFQQRIRTTVGQMEEASRVISLVMLDIDDFKPVNDTCGHMAGDEVLKEVARAVEAVAGKDNVYRYGGDEFAVVLLGADEGTAYLTAANLQRKVSERLASQPTPISDVTISLGVACYPLSVNSVEELIYGADAAMYWAKSQGKNRIGKWAALTGNGEKAVITESPRHR
jgi:diguanylate cyclase (GGDEF)-like protein